MEEPKYTSRVALMDKVTHRGRTPWWHFKTSILREGRHRLHNQFYQFLWLYIGELELLRHGWSNSGLLH